jgi:hypothetical protein
VRFAYADPPYPGKAHFYVEKTEVNHAALVERLRGYDGWALSTASTTLREVWNLCPDARCAAWVKPFAVFKPGVNPGYTWEPVLFVSGRRRDRSEDTVRDHLRCGITLQRGLTGAKPEAFCHWILALVGWQPGDVMDDLYPGTGVMGRVVNQAARMLL